MDTRLSRCDDSSWLTVIGAWSSILRSGVSARSSLVREGSTRLADPDLRQAADGARADRDLHGDPPRLCRARVFRCRATRWPAALRQYAVRPAASLGPVRISSAAGSLPAEPTRSPTNRSRC